MDKRNYNQIDDFLQDQSFVDWIKGNDINAGEIWEKWLVENSDKREMLEAASDIVKGIQLVPTKIREQDVESALKKLNDTIDSQSASVNPFIKLNIKRRRVFSIMLKIAASAAFLVLAYWGVNHHFEQKAIVYQTGYGEQMDLKLADGTKVYLNANSNLQYKSKNPREVWLEGEAFFEVEKKPESGAKFSVHTTDLKVEVFGTAFNVNSFEEKTEVMLEEGKVRLQLKDGTETNMQPGELISFSSKTNKIIRKEESVNAELHTSWKDGVLIFKEITLGEAVQKIESTYGVEFIFKNETLAKRPISIAIPTRNLDLCINALQKSMDIKIENKENKLLIID